MRDFIRAGSVAEAREIQRSLKRELKIAPFRRPARLIAAADAIFHERRVFAAATLFGDCGLFHEQDALACENIPFDYHPGLLAFREGPAIVAALRKLTATPEIVLLDGHGIAHPEGFGMASHIGVILGIPSIGCAKSRLVGEYDEPGPEKGDWTYLSYRNRRVGAVVRTRANVRPLFVSPGHLADIETSVEIVLRCLSSYRIPEPLRRADRLSKMMRSRQPQR